MPLGTFFLFMTVLGIPFGAMKAWNDRVYYLFIVGLAVLWVVFMMWYSTVPGSDMSIEWIRLLVGVVGLMIGEHSGEWGYEVTFNDRP